MHPVLCAVGPFHIYTYGVMVALGFGLAVWLTVRESSRFGIAAERAIDLYLFTLIFGIIGARIAYCLLHIGYYQAHILEIVRIDKGGLAFHGGFIGGLAAVYVLARRARLPFLRVLDVGSPFVALAHAVGRIGCFLNGCCWGRPVPCAYIFAVRFPNDAVCRHPAQLYESAALIGLFLISRLKLEKRRFEGDVFLTYCIGYSLIRFLIEFVRGDNPAVWSGMTLSQLLSVVICLVSVVAYSVLSKKCVRSNSL